MTEAVPVPHDAAIAVVGAVIGTTTGPAAPAVPLWMCAPTEGRSMFATFEETHARLDVASTDTTAA